MPDNEQPSFLRKVMKFVANPATDWSKLDRKEGDTEQSGYSKNEIKEIIERKRRNDFVRKREFDALRKLRSKEANAAQVLMRASQFADSKVGPVSSPDERASTLRKIDEIEAQMSMQWWRTKQASANSSSAGGGGNLSSIPESNLEAQKAMARQHAPTDPMYLETKPPGTLAPGQGPPTTAPTQATAAGKPAALSPLQFQATEGFSASKLMVEIEEVTHDADLEEAAIRFANGDSDGAEASLKELIQPGADRAKHADTWLTLFDLYRATGDQHKFESLALDYADRFGQSSPTWLSLPALASAATPASATPVDRKLTWKSPRVIGPHDIKDLAAAVKHGSQPHIIDWGGLQEIGVAAIAPMTDEFARWADTEADFKFLSAARLVSVLAGLTPAGNRDVDQGAWRLRLAALRVMNMADEFDLAALDFCITYEVSPPGWEPSRCSVALLDTTASGFMGASSSMLAGLLEGGGPSSMPGGESSFMPPGSDAGRLVQIRELVGELAIDADAALADLDDSNEQTLQIDCSKLVRVDFAAAGALLNWTLERHGQGRQVMFLELHRLIALFFGVVGITGHATVAVRRD
jgi:ABC-type transporter Mla MlaB component